MSNNYKTNLIEIANELNSIKITISNLPDAGSDISDATAVPADIIQGKTAYTNTGKVTGTMPVTTVSTPSIEVNAQGLVTSQNTQARGYTDGGTTTNNKQLPTQASTTITPSLSTQTAVAAGKYTVGDVSVAPIPDDYIVTEELVTQDSLIAQIQQALQGKGAGSGGDVQIETCNVTLRYLSQGTPVVPELFVYYVPDPLSTLQISPFPTVEGEDIVLRVTKNSIIFLEGVFIIGVDGDITVIADGGMRSAAFIAGDCIITGDAF